MFLKALGIAFNLASVVFALTAAHQWHRSATYKVLPEQASKGETEIYAATDTLLMATLELQGRWSRRAAIKAGFAALFQALALICQTLSEF
jgi:hypothetical protein